MKTVDRRRSPVYRQLEAYEASWKKDHDALKECWAAVDTIAVGISTCSLMERVDRAWRDRVFRGVEDYCDETNEVHRALFELWLRVTDSLLADVARLEEVYYSVEGVTELRQASERVRAHLAGWQPPRLSRAVGLREMTLSPHAADELDRLVEQSKISPPSMPSRQMERRDASFLK